MKLLNVVLGVAVVGALGYGGFLVYQKHVSMRDTQEIVDTLQSYVRDESLYKFEQPKIKNKGVLVDPDSNYMEVPLLLDTGLAYNVCIPASAKVVTDYSTYIYDVNSTFRVNVVKGVQADNLAGSMSLLNAYDYSQNVVVTKPNLKQPQDVGILLYNDIGVVSSCYDNPTAYATILLGVGRNKTYDCSSIVAYEDKDVTKYYDNPLQIPLNESEDYTVFKPSMTDQAGATQYFYDDGELVEIAAMKGFEETKKDIEQRIGLANKASRSYDAVYRNGDSYFYGECGECTVLLIADTYNRTFAFFGIGDEARYNIALYLRSNIKY